MFSFPHCHMFCMGDHYLSEEFWLSAASNGGWEDTELVKYTLVMRL